eukprot:scaffold169131_cov31-Tisochrysis_lutea.AAC.2
MGASRPPHSIADTLLGGPAQSTPAPALLAGAAAIAEWAVSQVGGWAVSRVGAGGAASGGQSVVGSSWWAVRGGQFVVSSSWWAVRGGQFVVGS